MKMTIYKVKKSYDTDDNIFYQVIPYDFIGTFKALGLVKFIKFVLNNCRISKSNAEKLAYKFKEGNHEQRRSN